MGARDQKKWSSGYHSQWSSTTIVLHPHHRSRQAPGNRPRISLGFSKGANPAPHGGHVAHVERGGEAWLLILSLNLHLKLSLHLRSSAVIPDEGRRPDHLCFGEWEAKGWGAHGPTFSFLFLHFVLSRNCFLASCV